MGKKIAVEIFDHETGKIEQFDSIIATQRFLGLSARYTYSLLVQPASILWYDRYQIRKKPNKDRPFPKIKARRPQYVKGGKYIIRNVFTKKTLGPMSRKECLNHAHIRNETLNNTLKWPPGHRITKSGYAIRRVSDKRLFATPDPYRAMMDTYPGLRIVVRLNLRRRSDKKLFPSIAKAAAAAGVASSHMFNIIDERRNHKEYQYYIYTDYVKKYRPIKSGLEF